MAFPLLIAALPYRLQSVRIAITKEQLFAKVSLRGPEGQSFVNAAFWSTAHDVAESRSSRSWESSSHNGLLASGFSFGLLASE